MRSKRGRVAEEPRQSEKKSSSLYSKRLGYTLHPGGRTDSKEHYFYPCLMRDFGYHAGLSRRLVW